MIVEHNGQKLCVDVEWDSISEGYSGAPGFTGCDEAPGVDGLRFVITDIDGRDPTSAEAERLDEELLERYEKDSKFFDRVGEILNEYPEPFGDEVI